MNETKPNFENMESDPRVVLAEMAELIQQSARILHERGIQALKQSSPDSVEELQKALSDLQQMFDNNDPSEPAI